MYCGRQFLLHVAALLLPLLSVKAQIPIPCVSEESINTRTCCPIPTIAGQPNPGACGSNLGRGECVEVKSVCNLYNLVFDPRQNWPNYYFDNVCKCNEPYAGFDCGECQFGRRGENCDEQHMRVRRSVAELTDDEWLQYQQQLNMSKNTISDRYVTLRGYNISDRNNIVNTAVYDIFVWYHHNAAFTDGNPNNVNGTLDFAHSGPGFPMWHRMYLLRFEREMQILLGNEDFTLHYWDWSDFGGQPDWTSVIFNDQKLGGYDENGNVTGALFTEENWPTVCWFPYDPDREADFVCDVSLKGTRLVRCANNSLCTVENRAWPTADNVSTVVNDFDIYDTPPYSPFSVDSFRNFMEGNKVGVNCSEDDTELCLDRSLHLLHNAVHIILGIGNFLDSSVAPDVTPGVMDDLPASPNDPAFFNHHTMVDCIIDQWIQKHPDVEYTGPTNDAFKSGHGKNDCLSPFIPVYTPLDFYKPARELGYTCDLRNFPPTTTDFPSTPTTEPVVVSDSGHVTTGAFWGVTATLIFIIIALVVIIAVVIIYLVLKRNRGSGGSNLTVRADTSEALMEETSEM